MSRWAWLVPALALGAGCRQPFPDPSTWDWASARVAEQPQPGDLVWAAWVDPLHLPLGQVVAETRPRFFRVEFPTKDLGTFHVEDLRQAELRVGNYVLAFDGEDWQPARITGLDPLQAAWEFADCPEPLILALPRRRAVFPLPPE